MGHYFKQYSLGSHSWGAVEVKGSPRSLLVYPVQAPMTCCYTAQRDWITALPRVLTSIRCNLLCFVIKHILRTQFEYSEQETATQRNIAQGMTRYRVPIARQHNTYSTGLLS